MARRQQGRQTERQLLGGVVQLRGQGHQEAGTAAPGEDGAAEGARQVQHPQGGGRGSESFPHCF